MAFSPPPTPPPPLPTLPTMSDARERAGQDATDACGRLLAAFDDMTGYAMAVTSAEAVVAIEALIDAKVRIAMLDIAAAANGASSEDQGELPAARP